MTRFLYRGLTADRTRMALSVLIVVSGSVTAIVALALLSSTAAAQTSATISGQIINGTLSVAVVDTPVTLHIMGADGHEDRESTADSQGFFSFSGPDLSPEYGYHVSARYKGALYGVDLSADESGAFPGLELPVYEPMDDTETLSAETWWIILRDLIPEERALEVVEMLDLRNDGDRTYVTTPEEMLRFPLFPDVGNFEATTDMYGRDFVRLGDGLALQTGIPPGVHHVMYSYWVLLEEESEVWSFQRTTPLKIQDLQVLAATNIRVDSPDFQSIGSTTIDGEKYTVLSAGAGGAEMMTTFNVMSANEGGWAEIRVGIGLAVALTIAMLLVAAGFVAGRRRSHVSVSGQTDVTPADPSGHGRLV